MKSKKSFFKSGIIKQDIRQHGWISIVYFICLLFVVPLELLQLASRDYVVFEDYKTYLMVNTEIQVLLLFSIPVAAGLLLFRYLQNEASVDMVHSLPIRREILYINHILSGLLLLLIPILLASCVTYFITRSIEEFDSILSITDLFSWTGLVILITCLMFTFTVAVGMTTGMSSAQAILTYIFLFLPFGMVTMVNYNLSFLLFGFPSFFNEEKQKYLSPFIRLIDSWGQTEPITTLEIIIYWFFTVCFLALGIGLYKARKLESATDVIAFPFLRPIFKYGVTFCSMILGGTYFSATTTLNWNWMLFGYISGAIIGYVAAEMILQKTWRIFHFRMLTGFIGYSVIFIIILLSIKTDLFNYENKLPRMDQIEEVYFGNKYYLQVIPVNKEDVFSKDKIYIQDIRGLHEYITSQKALIESQKDEDRIYQQDFMISYHLNDGSTLTREYSLPVNVMKEKLKPVMEAEQYKMNLPEIVQMRDDILSIKIVPNGPSRSQVLISEEKEIEEFKNVVKKEILSQKYDDLTNSPSPWGYIEFSYSEIEPKEQLEGYLIDWKKSYSTITKWLDEHDYLDDARINPEDIVKAEVTKISRQQNNEEIYIPSPDEMYQTGEKFATITDKNVISDALQKFTEYSEQKHTYYIKFILKDGNSWYGVIPDEHVPAEIEQQLK